MDAIDQAFQQVKKSAQTLALLSSESKRRLLINLAEVLLLRSQEIMAQNAKDLQKMAQDNPMRDRLLLNEQRIQTLAKSLHEVASLPDPTRQVLLKKTLANGLSLEKITVPLGVVGVIYESRPNVTIDVAALCLLSGNGVILRGGSDAEHSNTLLVACIQQALAAAGLPKDLVYLMPSDRALLPKLLQARDLVDVIIPRGSDALIQMVRKESLVPCIETGAGVCHTYVAASAKLKMAQDIVLNAKVSRPSVCNALDTILLHESIAGEFLRGIAPAFQEYKVQLYADAPALALLSELPYPYVSPAHAEDFGREYLDYACSVRLVPDFTSALDHIASHSSKHSEAIVSEDEQEAENFLAAVDAAAVYWNASTRFTDGGVFELGAEIGISTQKLHARGPFALEKLVCEKWVLRGQGQTRW